MPTQQVSPEDYQKSLESQPSFKPALPVEYQDSFQKAQAAAESQILADFKDRPAPSAEVANDVVKNFGLNTPGPFKAANTLASLQPKPAQTYDEPAFATQADQASITPSGPAVPYDVPTITTTPVPANSGTVFITGTDIPFNGGQFDSNPLGFQDLSDEGPAEQLSVDDSFELLFDLVADLSGRLQSLEDRITLHNVRSSHKI